MYDDENREEGFWQAYEDYLASAAGDYPPFGPDDLPTTDEIDEMYRSAFPGEADHPFTGVKL